jgi:hypothetical protein
MSKTSFEKALHIRVANIDELDEADLYDHIVVKYISEINNQRKSSGNPPLFLDENCSEAAKNSFQSIGNLQSLLKTHEVVGSDFSHISHEHNSSMTPSMSQNKSILEGFIQSFASIDQSKKSIFFDVNFNSIGLSVKRSFGSFKIMAIFFKKSIIINHLEYDISSGFKLSGKMLDPFNSIFLITLKDGKESAKPGIAGPKRIIVKSDYREFEAIITRILISSRSANEKIVEFYTIKAEPRSIGYNSGQDLTCIPPDATLAHITNFNGLWESNLMFESRSLSESILIKENYEKNVGSKIMVQNTSDFRGKPSSTVRTRPTSSIPPVSRNEWGGKGTPWKSTVTGSLSTIPESNRETEMKIDAWPGNKENFAVGRGDSNMFLKGENRGDVFSTTNNFSFNNVSGSNPFASSTPIGNPFASNMASSSNPFREGGQGSASGSSNNYLMSASTPQGYSSMTMSNPMNQVVPGQYVNGSGNPVMTGNQFSQGPYNSGFMSAYPGAFQGPMYPQVSNFNQGVPFNNPPPGNYGPGMQGYNPFFNQQNVKPPWQQHFSHPAFSDPSMLYNQEQCFMNMQGITSLPFALKGSLLKESGKNFYPLKNDEGKKEKKKNKKEKKIQKIETNAKTTVEKNVEVLLPGFTQPIPDSLVQEIRRLKPENESYARLFESMDHFDILLRVRDTDFKAHKAVIYSSSRTLRDQLDKARSSSVLSSKLVLPSWIQIDPFKLVLKFMYTSSLHSESIPINLSLEMLSIADYLQMSTLCDVLIIQFILTQITNEDSLSLIKMAVTREKEPSEGWEYLISCCLNYIGKHSNTIVRNFRAECLALPVPCILRIVDASMKYLSSLDHASLVIKLMTDVQYAHCVFELTQKVTDLYLFGYNNHYIDIQKVDFVRPLTKEQILKLGTDVIMEYPLIEENAPFFLNTSRASQVPAKKLPESVNKFMISGKTLTILQNKEIRARGKSKFSFTVKEIHRPKNVMSQCFSSETRFWSILVQTSKEGFISLFLCERGKLQSSENFISLYFTSVLFEIEIEDEGLQEFFRSNNRPDYSAGFYSFPNDQNHMIGERNFCKVSNLSSIDSVKINVYIREVGIHSGLLHYLCENFDTLNSAKSEKFRDLDSHNMKYLLSSDHLNICSERDAAGALWKYSANKSIDCIDLLVSEVRFGFLTTKDLLTIARDHSGFRSSENFRFIFENEFLRRLENKKNSQRPRRKYENLSEITTAEYKKEIINWILDDHHHEGYVERISKLKKELAEARKETQKVRSENLTRKTELETSKASQILPDPRLFYEADLRVSESLKYDSDPRSKDFDPYSVQDKNCQIF